MCVCARVLLTQAILVMEFGHQLAGADSELRNSYISGLQIIIFIYTMPIIKEAQSKQRLLRHYTEQNRFSFLDLLFPGLYLETAFAERYHMLAGSSIPVGRLGSSVFKRRGKPVETD